jgi:hypothetical protein
VWGGGGVFDHRIKAGKRKGKREVQSTTGTLSVIERDELAQDIYTSGSVAKTRASFIDQSHQNYCS